MSNDDNQLCPICKDIMIFPRIYACGHTICEPCMIKTDKLCDENNNLVFTATIYKCPLCRSQTYLDIQYRPINRILLDQLRKDPEYEQKYNEYIKNKKDNIEEFSEKIDLGKLTYQKREDKSSVIYNEILPILYKAARKGQPFVTITHNNKNIQLVSDLLANKLFINNNIYKLLSTPRECTIDIIPSKKSYKNEFINAEYTEISSSMEIISTSTSFEIPPPPPPLPPPRNLPPLSITRSANDFRNIVRRLQERRL